MSRSSHIKGGLQVFQSHFRKVCDELPVADGPSFAAGSPLSYEESCSHT